MSKYKCIYCNEFLKEQDVMIVMGGRVFCYHCSNIIKGQKKWNIIDSEKTYSKNSDNVSLLSIKKKLNNNVKTYVDVEKNGFMIIEQVVKTSSAWDAGLRNGDIIFRFGEIKKENYIELDQIINLVQMRIGCHIGIQAYRIIPTSSPQEIPLFEEMNTTVCPVQWSGGAVMGMVVNQWPRPTPPTTLNFSTNVSDLSNFNSEVSIFNNNCPSHTHFFDTNHNKDKDSNIIDRAIGPNFNHLNSTFLSTGKNFKT